MHISKIVDYVKNEINFSEEFCEDNVFVTLRIEPILKIIENLEQSHKYILEYDKEIKKKDKIIELILEDMLKGKCYFSSKTLLKKHYESKVEK